MKKIYSFVLMATMLLIGTNIWADPIEVTSTNENISGLELQTAINNVAPGASAELKLMKDVVLEPGKPIWIGTYLTTDDAKDITLDLNGHNITCAPDKVGSSGDIAKGQFVFMFIVSHGQLKVVNKAENESLLSLNENGTYKAQSNSAIFMVFGSPDPSSSADLFTYLSIGENIKLTATRGSGVQVDVARSEKWRAWDQIFAIEKQDAYNMNKDARLAYYGTEEYAPLYGRVTTTTDVQGNPGYYATASGQGTPSAGYAYGVRVDIKCKMNFADPYSTETGHEGQGQKTYCAKSNGIIQKPAANAKNVPYVHIFPQAELIGDPYTPSAAAVYSGGYVDWLIEGKCTAASGVYMKSGEVTLNNATVESTWSGDASIDAHQEGNKTGVNATGNAVTIESAGNYPGDVVLDVQGDTKISTEANGGAAIVDFIGGGLTTTRVDSINIDGGTLSGDYAIVISEITAESTTSSVTASGVALVGTTNVGDQTGAAALNKILSDDSHITTVTNEDGTTTIVISAGSDPTVYTDWDLVPKDGTGDVKWEGLDPVEITSDLTFIELQINKGSKGKGGDSDTLQVLTVKNNATLTVDRLIMNAFARITVEAGSKLIVKGTQGITAPVVENITLKASELSRAMFLFHPAVTSNRHPNATVEFVSKSYTISATNHLNQRFGIPTHEALKKITAKNNNVDVATGFGWWNGSAWEIIGYINYGTTPFDYTKMANPFQYYQMQHNTPNIGTIVTMEGELYGNANPALNIQASSWNGFANSFMAPIDGQMLIDMIPNTVDKAFYLSRMSETEAAWDAYTLIDLDDMPAIAAMQPFMIRNTKAAANVTLNYEEAVYNPAMDIVPNNPAPRRAAMNDMTKVRMIVNGENNYDRLTVAEGDEFSAEFDNGYDAVKYMNEGLNLYVSADEKMSNFATDNLEDTYVGLQTVKGGNYTIEFAKVQGNDLTLIDLETGAQVAMVEGNVYEFTAAANSTNDYRFRIVSTRKVMTAMENTEAVKSAKGIYTITGQYVGEMNVWNSLPAGVYVVNGAKCVK